MSVELKEMVERLKKYNIMITEQELMERQKKRLMKSLKDSFEAGYVENINTSLRELERMEE